MRTTFRRFGLRMAAALVVALAAASCATEAPPVRQFADLRFTHKAPMTFTAQGPEVVSNYQPPLADPNVEHLMPLPPERAIRTWVQDRVRATGVGQDVIRVVIRDASVVERPLEVKQGVTGFFTDDQELAYDARVEVAVELLGPSGEKKGETVVTGQRSRTINEKASLREREKLWYELVERLMQDVDESLERNIRTYFTPALLN